MAASRIFLIVSLVVLTLFLVYGFLDPATHAIFPKCPFLTLTGYQCPGCGSQRAAHQLLHGNITKALQYNTLFVLFLPYIFLGIFFGLPAFKNKYLGIQRILFGYKTIYLILAIIIVFWLFRGFLPWAI